MKPQYESKEERFIRIAEARVNKVICMIDLLGNLSNTMVYSFTFDQVDHMFTAIQEALAVSRKRFLQPHQTRRKRFRLGEPYAMEEPCPANIPPTIHVALPDGTSLRAVAHNGGDYPCVDIYWDTDGYLSGEKLCFVEYNPEKTSSKRVCIGVYQADSDETKYYAPYNGRKEMT